MLEITSIRLNKFEKGNLLAFVNFTFNKELTIDGFKLMNGREGKWLACPSKRNKDNTWSDIVKLSKELREDLFERAIEEYEKSSSPSSNNGSKRSRRR